MKRLKIVALSSAVLVGAVIIVMLARGSSGVDPGPTGTLGAATTEPAKEAAPEPSAIPKTFGDMNPDQRQQLRQEFGAKFQACLASKLSVAATETEDAVVRQDCLAEVRQAIGMFD